MIGSVVELSDLADRAHRLVAVHLRHHDVHQHDVDVGRPLQDLDAVAARSRRTAPSSRGARARWSARRCCARRRRRSSTFLPASTGSGLAQLRAASAASARAGSPRRGGGTAPSRRAAARASCTSLTMIVSASRCELGLLLGRQLLAGVDDDRQVARARGSSRIVSISSKPLMSGRPQVEHHAVEALRRAGPSSASAPVPTAVVSTSPSPISSTMLSRCVSSSSTTSRLLHAALDERSIMARARRQRLAADRLLQVGEGARASSRALHARRSPR